MTRLLLPAVLLVLSLGAAAQTVTVIPPPASVQTVLDDVRASLSAPRTAQGPLRLSLTLRSSLAFALPLDVSRDPRQNCAFVPSVRVLRVGTREVVYPTPGAEPRLCAQDLESRVLAAGGETTFTRELDLLPGEYMVEGWYAGLLGGERVKVPARPVRVTVRE
ncbi:hypothetical protein QOL99_12360 [Deinococcus sp. MIMF12]|uniref:Uncharacterized protein n=1 Tax=Deinococcus rhizophilus TaxID=3049544 RepID=A0ABT7JIP4_9DEIO|nr:hypothetical protein [Deinococcus rhizophilus]MDL2344935.1 hypothetical protein [Deinococcus rhizophilus]